MAGNDNTFPTTMELPDATYVIYAYGIKNNGKASVIEYMDYIAPLAQEHAELEVVRTIVVKGGSLTATCAYINS